MTASVEAGLDHHDGDARGAKRCDGVLERGAGTKVASSPVLGHERQSAPGRVRLRQRSRSRCEPGCGRFARHTLPGRTPISGGLLGGKRAHAR